VLAKGMNAKAKEERSAKFASQPTPLLQKCIEKISKELLIRKKAFAEPSLFFL